MAYRTGLASLTWCVKILPLIAHHDARGFRERDRSELRYRRIHELCAARAVARHIGVPLQTKDWETVGHSIPLLANIQPAGEFLSEGLLSGRRSSGDYRRTESRRQNSRECDDRDRHSTIGSNCESAGTLDPQVIRRFDDPLMENAGFLVVSGNLFESAIVKTSRD